MKDVERGVSVMKKEEIPIEKTFGDFLELLEADAADAYTGFLFQFIQEIVASTMNLGKGGFAPVLNFTVYAKQTGIGDGFEMIIRPSRSSNPEGYEALKLDQFANRVMEAFKAYAVETCGMTPVIDEREDLRKQISGDAVVEQWKGVVDEN